MKKVLRVALYTVLLFLLLTGIALAVGLYNPRAYEGLLNKLVYKKTGYQYSTQDLSIQLSPTKISIQGLELNNPEWSQDPKLLTVGNADVSVDLKQLLNKQLPYWQAEIHNAEVQLIEDNDGKLNWHTSVLANQPKPESEEPLNLKDVLSFSEVSIDQAKLRQQKPDVTEEIDISSLLLKRTSDASVKLQGAGIYKEQNVDIEGVVDIEGQNPAKQILQFAMQATGLGIDLQTNGAINPNNLDGTKVSLKAKSDNLAELEKFLETTFPAVTPIDVSLDLLSTKGNYEVSKINLQMGENLLSGDVLYDTSNSFVRANLFSEKINLGPFIPAEGAEKSSEATQENVKKDVGEPEIDWAWMNALNSEINLKVGEILANEHRLKDFASSLKLNEGVLNIDSLNARYQLENKENPEQSFITDLIKISGTLKPLAEKTQGKDVQLAVNITDGNASLALEGDANINGVEGDVLKINADATNLDSLSKFLQTDLSPYLPAKVNAQIETSANAINVQQITANSKDSDIAGNVEIDWSGDVVKAKGKVLSRLLDLSPLMAEPKEGQKKSSEDKNNQEKKEKVFSDEPIDWSWLEAYDVDFDLGIDKLIASDNVFNKVKTKIELGKGALNIKPFQAFFADGTINTVLTLNKAGDAAKFNTKLDAINLSLAALGATGDSVLEGGTTDVVADFNGQGKSLHHIMASLNGEMVAEVQKGIIKNDAFEIIGSDIILELLTMLNPFMKEDETTELECAAVKFTAEDGVLTSKNQMAVETTKMKIVGGGVIDMNTEELEIGFSPSAKKGVGVNVGSLVKFVRLGGTLSNPHPEADPVGILKSGAALGAAVSTGGLSLLVEGLFKRAANAGSACNQALSDTPEMDTETTATTPSTTDSPE